MSDIKKATFSKSLVPITSVMIAALIASTTLAINFINNDIYELNSENNLTEIQIKDIYFDVVVNIAFISIFIILIVFGLKKLFALNVTKIETEESNENKIISNVLIIINSIQNDKKLLIIILIAVTMFSMGIASLFLAYDAWNALSLIEEIDEIKNEGNYFWSTIIIEVVFGVVFLIWSISYFTHTFLRIYKLEVYQQNITKEEISKSKLYKIKKRIEENPEYKIFFYVILLPTIFTALIFLGESILDIINLMLEITITIETYAAYLFMIFLVVIDKKYVKTFRKIEVKEHFEILGSKYILKERKSLEKIRFGSIISIIIVSIVVSSIHS